MDVMFLGVHLTLEGNLSSSVFEKWMLTQLRILDSASSKFGSVSFLTALFF